MRIFILIMLFSLFILIPINADAFVAVNDEYYNYQHEDYLGPINFIATNHRETPEGNGVVVAVIDSGVWQEHPDLANNIWVNSDEVPNNNLDDDHNGYIDDYYGYNFISNNSNMVTLAGHGTAVAGIIAAKRDAEGILGIANKAKIMSLIVCDSDGCSDNAIQNAIKYAADNGADIINLSLGGNNGYIGHSSSYDYYIKYAFDRDVVVVAAAGNGNPESYGAIGINLNNFPVSPVCNDNDTNMIIGVGANDASWSNYGDECVDVKAPATEIVSDAVPIHDIYAWKYWNGTSFSAPMVSATAAIIKSMKPSLKNWEIINIIIENSVGGNLDVDKALSLKQSYLEITGLDKNQYSRGDKINVLGKHFPKNISAVLKSNLGQSTNYVGSVTVTGPNSAEIILNNFTQSGDYVLEIISDKIFNSKWTSQGISIGGDANNQSLSVGSPVVPVGLYALANIEGSPVYLVGNGKKYIFPDSKTYFTWYKDFNNVNKVNSGFLDNYLDGGSVGYKPGSKLITHTNTAKIYAVEKGNILRWVPSEEIALNLYGSNWAELVQDVIPGFFATTYTIGDDLLDKLPTGTIVREGNSDNYYYIDDNQKRRFSSINILRENGFNEEDAVLVNNLNLYSTGAIIDGFEDTIGYYVPSV